MIASVPYLMGMRIGDSGNMWVEGTNALQHQGNYMKNLMYARLGNLPFWLLSCMSLYFIVKGVYGSRVAFLSVVLFTLVPPLLGHAAIAYTDTALVAGILLFAWQLREFVEKQTIQRSVALGAAIGVAVAAKYSAIPYIAASLVAVGLLQFARPFTADHVQMRKLRFAHVLAAGVVATLVLWGCFRFSLEPVSANVRRNHPTIIKFFGWSPQAEEHAYRALVTPIPLSELVRGVNAVAFHAKQGHWDYHFGRVDKDGSWYYFPVMLALTIPASLLLLCLVGVWSLFRRSAESPRGTQMLYLCLVGICVLTINMMSSINIGYRHNLAVYPFVCILGAIGLKSLWRNPARWPKWIAIICFSSCMVESAAAHPKYTAFINILANHKSTELCIDSAEGGDEWRLAERLRRLKANHVCLGLTGPLPLAAFGFPDYIRLERNKPCKGYVAVDLYRLHFDFQNAYPPDTGLQWLERYKPIEKIGSSILLYRIE